MPTYAELDSEIWWDREIITPELDELGDVWCQRTGRPRSAFGTKGNNVHLSGGHRSQEWLLNSRYCTNRTYTVQSGLVGEQPRHIAAFDFTPGVWGTTDNRAKMRVLTQRLVMAAKAGLLTGMTQIIGTLDGVTIYGYNVVTGGTFAADKTHLDHVHGTFNRKYMRDRALMQRILSVALGETTIGDGDMAGEGQAVLGILLDGVSPTGTETFGGGVDRIYLYRRIDEVLASIAAAESREVARDAAQTAMIQQLAAHAGVELTDEQAAAIGQQVAGTVAAAVNETRQAVLAALDRQEREREAAMRAALAAETAA